MRLEKEERRASSQQRRNHHAKKDEVDEREGRVTSRGPPSPRSRRDRVYPDGSFSASTSMSSKSEHVDSVRKSRRRLSKGSGSSKNGLKIEANSLNDSNHEYDGSTPRTEASTPSNSSKGIRGNSDLRSPGQRMSPKVAAVANDDSPLPDFITQTDKYGNATTPRTDTAIKHAREDHPNGALPHLHVGKNGKLTESVDDVDACTETLLDSIRIMCCCLMPDEESSAAKQVKGKEEKKAEQQIITRPSLLPDLHPDDTGKKCLVLDLDETLVHSSFRAVPGADFVIPVQVRYIILDVLFVSLVIHSLTVFVCPNASNTKIEDVVHFVYVAKRPGVDEFLIEMAKHYEIVIYTASLNKYADPLLDLLDPNRVIRTRLFRESCVYYEGNYVKDLSLLDRDLSQAIIIDNSPSSYSFHPENAIDCSSFIDDPKDRELDQIAAFLTGIKDVENVRGITRKWREWPNVNLEGQ